MIKILQAFQVTIQDYPGRVGFMHLGIPSSGAMDGIAHRTANMLVGNDPSEAALECLFKGPTIEFLDDTIFSVCGARYSLKLDDKPIPMWTTVYAKKGQILQCGFPVSGAYGYIAFRGGIDVPSLLGSKSTYVFSNLGGHEGRCLKTGDILKIGDSAVSETHEGMTIRKDLIPEYASQFEIELLLGSHWDWLTEKDIETVYNTDWIISNKSNRLGYRLEGPEFEFSKIAWEKPAECGSFPSNIFDTGYYLGGVNLAGQTLVVFMADGPTAGGYIQPFIVPDCCLWKIAQTSMGMPIKFKRTEISDMAAVRNEFEQYVNKENYI